MIQQSIAASTAIIFSLSFIPYGQGKQQSPNALNIPHAMSHVSNDPSVLPVPVATFSNFFSNEQANKGTPNNGVTPDSNRGGTLLNGGTQSQDNKSSKGLDKGEHSNIEGKSAQPTTLQGSIHGSNQGDSESSIMRLLGLVNCHHTQNEISHHKDWNGKSGGHIFATDIVCPVQNKTFPVHAPNSEEFYIVQHVGWDPALGNYMILQNGDIRYVFAHTENTMPLLKGGDRVEAGEVIGYVNVSGMSLGLHVHVEKWIGQNNVKMLEETVNEFSSALCTQRQWKFCQEKPVAEKYYFTHYDLGDISQNDNSPCKGASGADLCFLARQGVNTMALTSDIRKKLDVKWGDKVILEGDDGCKGIYEVHDEMNARFRNGCIKRPGTDICIKGDLPGKPGGACTVQKINY